jgi:hypothetical protein
MSQTIAAKDLQKGHIIDKVDGNPNIRGTVIAVCSFSNPQAALLPGRTPIIPANYKGSKEHNDVPTSQVNRVRTPMAGPMARAVAREVERCYTEDNPTSVSVKVGHHFVTIAADTLVKVWVPASDAERMWAGKVA